MVSCKPNQNPKKKVYKPFKQFINHNICYKKAKHKTVGALEKTHQIQTSDLSNNLRLKWQL
jgi:hypothetical protein